MRQLFTFFLLCSFFVNAQGLNPISKNQLEEIERFENGNLGFSENLPPRHSMEKYVPPVRNQYNTSTCVGFAMGYYAISTIHNQHFNRTSYAEKFFHGFDPFYAYTLNDENCDNGLNMLQAFSFYSNMGAKKEFSPIVIDCENPASKIDADKLKPFIAPYQLEKFEWIQTFNSRFIGNVKEAIANNSPVIIGANLTDSFYDAGKLWRFNEEEYKDDNTWGHAMCVVGYDDSIFGGSFRIVNSWGTNWADNGFIWIKYEDFYEIVSEAYVIKPYKIDNSRQQKFVKFNETYVSWISDDDMYTYEGQVDPDGFNGYGISTSRNGKEFISAGYFVKGKQNGYHLASFDNDFYGITYEMGEVVESKELGFATTASPFEKQISRYGTALNIKNPSSRDIDSLNKIKKSPVGNWKIRPPKPINEN